jgi:hypothetical protein
LDEIAVLGFERFVVAKRKVALNLSLANGLCASGSIFVLAINVLVRDYIDVSV